MAHHHHGISDKQVCKEQSNCRYAPGEFGPAVDFTPEGLSYRNDEGSRLNFGDGGLKLVSKGGKVLYVNTNEEGTICCRGRHPDRRDISHCPGAAACRSCPPRRCDHTVCCFDTQCPHGAYVAGAAHVQPPVHYAPPVQYPIGYGAPSYSHVTGVQSFELPGVQSLELPTTQTVQVPTTQTVQVPSMQTVQVPTTRAVQVPTTRTVQIPTTRTVQIPTTRTVQVPTTRTVQVPSMQTVQVPSTQTVQLQSTETLQYPSVESVQIQGAGVYQTGSSTAAIRGVPVVVPVSRKPKPQQKR